MSGTVLANLGLTGDIADHDPAWGNEGRANDRRLDALVMASVKSVSNSPPPSPSDGDRYLIGTSPTGEWAPYPNQIATWNASAWSYYAQRLGWSAYDESMHAALRYVGTWANDDLVVNVKRYGAKGDGVTNDTAAVLDAISAAPAGSRLHFPAGTYVLSTWAVYTLNRRLWISGDGMGNTILRGTAPTISTNGVDFLSVTADFRCSDLTLDSWGVALGFSAVSTILDKVLIENVEIKNYLRGVYGSNAVAGLGFRGFAVRSCRFTTGLREAIFMNLGIMERVHIDKNVIVNCVGKGIDLGGNALALADVRGEYLVEGNIINGVTNYLGVIATVTATFGTDTLTTASAHGLSVGSVVALTSTIAVPGGLTKNVSYFVKTIPTTTTLTLAPTSALLTTVDITDNGTGTHTLHRLASGSSIAVIVYGWRCAIVGNTVSNVSKFDPNASDTDGIYTKCRYSNIVGNVLVDASQAESAINIKGGARNESVIQPYGFAVVCADNMILDTQVNPTAALGFKRSNGIKIATSEVLCANNHIEGMCEAAIYTDSDTGSDAPCHNVTLLNNVIKDHRGSSPIRLYGRGDRIRVINNLIDTVYGSFGTPAQNIGIDFAKKEGIGTDIIGNRIYNVVNAGSAPIGISINPGGITKIVSVDPATDTFTATEEHLGAPIAHTFLVNDQVRFTTLNTLPGGLTLGQFYFVIASGLTANNFKISTTLGGSALDITSAGVGECTAIKKAALSDVRVMDNHIDGAQFGVQFTWDETTVALDGVFVRHNTGRNINGNLIPVLTDLVKFSDTPTNLLYLPAETPVVSYESTDRAAIYQASGTDRPQELRIYRNRIDASGATTGNFERVVLRAKSSAGMLATEFNGNVDTNGTPVVAQKRALEFGVGQTAGAVGTPYWRVATSGNFEPLINDALAIGKSDFAVKTLHMCGELNLARLDAGSLPSGNIILPSTNAITAGNQTINKISGRVIVTAGTAVVVVTNDKLSATSHIFCQITQVDSASPRITSVVYSAGPAKFTITLTVVTVADMAIDFVVFNSG